MQIREGLEVFGLTLQSQVCDPIARMWNPDLTAAARSFVDRRRDALARCSSALRLALENYVTVAVSDTSSDRREAAAELVGARARELAIELSAASDATTAAKDHKGQSDRATIDAARDVLDRAALALTRWYAEFRQFGVALLDRSSSFIDRVQAELDARRFPSALHEVSEGNEIRLIDTPHVWGRAPTEAGVAASATAAVKSLAEALHFLVGRATFKVDVLSLNPPSGMFLDTLFRALTDLARNLERGSGAVVVRCLFGWVPTRDTVTEFVGALAGLCRTERFPLDRMTVVVGQYCAIKGGWWNHAKLVAVDETRALVGGRDVWDAAYGQYPPIHDVSVLVSGKAALAAHHFAEFLWQRAGEFLVVKHIDPSHTVRTLEPGIGRDLCVLPKQVGLVDPGPRRLSKPVTDPFGVGVWKSGRVLSLGRAGGLVDGAYNAGDVARQLLVRHARCSVRICQPSLLCLDTAKPQEHLVCRWIVDALIENTDLLVEIVVSPEVAVATFEFLRDLVVARVDASEATPVLRRLCVAPLAFTEGVPAPGNQANVVMVDDAAYVIGSDNLHPHNLAEFSYLVEGPAVGEFAEAYWARVWSGSETLCVSDCCAAHREP